MASPEEKVAKLESEVNELKDLLGAMKLNSDKAEKELLATKSKLDHSLAESKTVYISKDRKLQKFSGHKAKDSDLSIEEWIDDASYHLKNISHVEAQIEFLFDHLQGQARDELRVIPESDRKIPARIFDALRALFQDVDTVAQIQQAFYQRSQRQNETLQQYSLALLKLMDKLCKKQREAVGDKELMLRERFIDGVIDGQLKREMRRFSMDHPSIPFHEFRTVVMKWCEDDRKQDQVTVDSDAHDVDVSAIKKEPDVDVLKLLQNQQELLMRQQEQLDKLSAQMALQPTPAVFHSSRGGRGSPGRRSFGYRGGWPRGGFPRCCYRCGSPEHFIKDCPTPESQLSTESQPLN
ncbi:MAG: zinc finger CCHC domain-containing protein [Sedimenticola sp.]